MANATAYISAEDIQSSQDWNAWFFDRQSGYIQVNEDWYAWNFERAPIQTEATAELGEILLLTSAFFELEGIEATTELGTVTASGTAEMVMVPSRESYRKPKKSAVISIIGLDMASDVGKPIASGTIIINNSAKIFSIEAQIEAKAVQAEGVLNLSDEEIILLMAA